MRKKHAVSIASVVSILIAAFVLSYLVIPLFTKDLYFGLLATDKKIEIKEDPIPLHIKTPEAVKGIYMTSCVVGTPKLRDGLVQIADTTEVNSIVIDIKDFSGTLSFEPKNPELKQFVSDRCGATDMESFVRLLHSKNIYVIGRITVFQDPFLTKLRPDLAVKRASDGGVWKDRKGISYLDPGSKEAWDHVIAIATSSYAIGFDEINFDYIRFPSDGNMRDIAFPYSGKKPKPEVLESFFSYLHDHLATIPISADLFGMTTTSYSDLNIGQILERTLPYFDFIDPMVYPSHYPADFNGWQNPNAHPYDLIYFVMKSAAVRAEATSSPIDALQSERIGTGTPAMYTKDSSNKNKLRPWIQDFNYGGTYGPKEVRAQIQASYDVGLNSWLIWSPSNKYTIQALIPDNATTTLKSLSTQ